MTVPPPSKTATLKAEREARKLQRIADKEKELRTLLALKERAEDLCKKMPTEFQDWGVTKTRAYLKLMTITKHKAGLSTIKSKRLAVFVNRLACHSEWTLDYCQSLSMLSDCAADVSCKDDS